MGRGQDNDRIVLPCKFGKLMCEVMRSDEDYREFAIDLVREDGKAYQIAVIGTNEYDECNGDDLIHIHLWDGNFPDDPTIHHMNPNGDGFFAEDYAEYREEIA